VNIYLVRHGQSEGNAQGFFQGNIDSPLTSLGQRQAAHLADWLAQQGLKPDAIYTSPLSRAAATAQTIADKLGVGSAIPEEGLREYRAGKLEGLLPDEVAEKFPQYLRRGLEERGDFSAYGGESYEEMQGRLKAFIKMVIEKHGEQSTVMAVSHGGAIYQLLKLWCAWPTPRHFFAKLDNCICVKLVLREIGGLNAGELQWMIPLELTGWHVDGGQAWSGRTDWVERE